MIAFVCFLFGMSCVGCVIGVEFVIQKRRRVAGWEENGRRKKTARTGKYLHFESYSWT